MVLKNGDFGHKSHPFRQYLQWFYEFPKNRKTQKIRFSSDKILTNQIWVYKFANRRVETHVI